MCSHCSRCCGSGAAHLVLRGSALSPGLESLQAEPSIGRDRIQLSHPGQVTPWLGLGPGRAGLACGGRCGGSPGARSWVWIPAAVTQCCGQSPANQDLGLGSGQQLHLPCTAEAVVPPGLGFMPCFLFLGALR